MNDDDLDRQLGALGTPAGGRPVATAGQLLAMASPVPRPGVPRWMLGASVSAALMVGFGAGAATILWGASSGEAERENEAPVVSCVTPEPGTAIASAPAPLAAAPLAPAPLATALPNPVLGAPAPRDDARRDPRASPALADAPLADTFVADTRVTDASDAPADTSEDASSDARDASDRFVDIPEERPEVAPRRIAIRPRALREGDDPVADAIGPEAAPWSFIADAGAVIVDPPPDEDLRGLGAGLRASVGARLRPEADGPLHVSAEARVSLGGALVPVAGPGLVSPDVGVALDMDVGGVRPSLGWRAGLRMAPGREEARAALRVTTGPTLGLDVGEADRAHLRLRLDAEDAIGEPGIHPWVALTAGIEIPFGRKN